uniref:Uncharacterized protein n=1 Tax=Parascaris univalens TaxID=6257 RepID=A0A915A3E8_PARUN
MEISLKKFGTPHVLFTFVSGLQRHLMVFAWHDKFGGEQFQKHVAC